MKKDEIKVGSTLSYIIIVVNTLAGVIITPYMLRILGQDMYGLYTLIGSFVSYMNLMDFGIATTVVRYISKFRAEKREKEINKFISTILGIYSIISILVIIVGIVIYLNLEKVFATSIPSGELKTAQIMFAITIFNVALTMFMKAFPAVINAYEKFIFSKALDIFRIIVRTISIFICLKLKLSVISIVIIDTTLNIILMLIRVIYIKVNIKITLKFKGINYKFAKEIFGFSVFVFLSSFINIVNTKLDQFMLGFLSTTVQIAISGVSASLISYFHTFASALSGMFLPKITGLVAKKTDIKIIEKFAIKIGRIQMKLLILVFIGFYLLGKEFVKLWAGQGYDDVYWIVLILMLANILPYSQAVLLSLTQAMNKHGARNLIYLGITIANIILTVPLAKAYGALGAAVATGLTMGIGYAVFIQAYYHKKIKINMFKYTNETIIKAIPSIIITLIVGVFINKLPSGILFMMVKIIIITGVYCISVWFTDTTEYEKNLFNKFFSKIFTNKNIGLDGEY